jgi:hypothetical protein
MSSYTVSLSQEVFNNMRNNNKKLEEEIEELKNRLKKSDENKPNPAQPETVVITLLKYKVMTENLNTMAENVFKLEQENDFLRRKLDVCAKEFGTCGNHSKFLTVTR